MRVFILTYYMTIEIKNRIVAKITSLEMLKRYSHAQLKTLTNDFDEYVVCQILSSLQVPDSEENVTLLRQEIQKQVLAYMKEAWLECHCSLDSFGHERYDAVMPEYFSDYDIVLISGEEITLCGIDNMKQEVAYCQQLEAENRLLKEKLAGMTGQEDLGKHIFRYLQLTKKKDVKKRGYIKMTIMELLSSAKIPLSDETQQLLDMFDDDVVSLAKDATDDHEAVLAYARLHPLASHVYLLNKAKDVISWLQNEVNTEARAKEQLAPIRAALDYPVIRKETPYEVFKKELGLTVSEQSFKNWVKGSRPKEFSYETTDLSGYADQIRDFMQR